MPAPRRRKAPPPGTTFHPDAVFVSDLHLGLKLPHAKVSGDMTTSDRLQDVLFILGQVADYCREHKVQQVFIAGDLFDQRHPDAPTLIACAEALTSLAQVGKEPSESHAREVILLPGNHDAHDRAGKVYALDLYDVLNVPGIRVMTYGDEGEPWHGEIQPHGTTGEPLHVYGFPWLPEPLFRERVQAIALVVLRPALAVFHQTLIGARDGGHVAPRGIDPGLFDIFDLGVSGHIHEPQDIGRVKYLGSPLHLRFTDAGQRRGFWALDAGRREWKLVETKFPEFVRWRFFEDDGITAVELAEAVLPELIEELSARVDANGKPVYLDVIVESEREDAEAAAARVRLFLDALGPDLLRVRRVTPIYTDDGSSSRVRAAASGPGSVATPAELVEAYVRSTDGVYPEDVSADELIAFGQEVMP